MVNQHTRVGEFLEHQGRLTKGRSLDGCLSTHTELWTLSLRLFIIQVVRVRTEAILNVYKCVEHQEMEGNKKKQKKRERNPKILGEGKKQAEEVSHV